MGNIIPAEVIFEGELRNPLAGVCDFRALATGNVRSFRLWANNAVSPGSTWYFNVRLSGVGQYTGTDRLALSFSSLSDAKTGLAIPITRGTTVRLDLEQPGIGSINGVTFLMEIEES